MKPFFPSYRSNPKRFVFSVGVNGDAL